MLRCTACGSSICGVPCATERWKQHRPECRRLQAVAFGEEYARKDDSGMRLNYAALNGEKTTMRRITIGLTVAVSKTKIVAKAGDVAMRALVDFQDDRMVGTAAYSAAQENRFEAVRLLHELRADLGKPNTVEGATPANHAATKGHTSMVQLPL